MVFKSLDYVFFNIDYRLNIDNVGIVLCVGFRYYKDLIWGLVKIRCKI